MPPKRHIREEIIGELGETEVDLASSQNGHRSTE